MELVLQAPGSISIEQPKRKVAAHTRNILRIENVFRGLNHENVQDSIAFTSANIKEAIAILQKNEGSIDAILVSPESITGDLITLKDLARKNTRQYLKRAPKALHSASLQTIIITDRSLQLF
jgi:hypothetical protein